MMTKSNTHSIVKVPKLRFGEFDDTWSKKQISEVAAKITDGTHDTPKPTNKGIPYLTAVHVKDGFIDFDNCYFLSKEEHQIIYKRCNPEKGDLLMVNIGAGTATSAMVDVDFEFSLKNVALIKPDQNILNCRFFAQIQRRNRDRLKHEISSGGAQPFLSLREIGKLRLIIPSLPEQQKIASFLKAVDQKLAQLAQKKSLLEQFKKGAMQQLFSQELRFKQADGSDFPDWKKSKIGDTCKILMCKRIFAEQTNEDGDVPFYKIGTIGKSPDAFISRTLFEEYKSKYNFPRKGEILITCSGTVGKCIAYDSKDAYYQDSNIVWVDNPRQEIKNEFLFFFLSKFNWGKLNSTTIARIYGSDLRNLRIKYPIAEEQQKIATFLSALDTKIETVAQQIAKAQTFKKGLLQKMFV